MAKDAVIDEAPARAWRTVLAHVERDLLDGRLGPGDRLPSERDLAADLGVGRSSVREALRVLEVMGLIRTATGSGPQAGAIVVARPGGGLSALLRLQVAAQGFPIGDVVRTRLVLERSVVADLAGAPSRDTSIAHGILDAMDDDRLSPAEFLALDAQLHLALAEASGNAVVAAMMTGLRDAIESYVLQGQAQLADWDRMAASLRAEHRAILRAIDEGDAQTASARIHDHIIGYHEATGLAGGL
ncbi:DNA-binding FadR family transcriptional regulator [Microbacterium resistens]|uniref:DNA-binding FadR family transcriptional regulator n=1 Tax=Microbacterium resistens TaxID=156977 RepID=A0ABU1SDP0_9MICO|nr:GntR family transcriptional regulator [Microbacterium resistens]MDR6867725.1 DNA-binding FadR family transcriptional regulator [Microbacterium resistens]